MNPSTSQKPLIIPTTDQVVLVCIFELISKTPSALISKKRTPDTIMCGNTACRVRADPNRHRCAKSPVKLPMNPAPMKATRMPIAGRIFARIYGTFRQSSPSGVVKSVVQICVQILSSIIFEPRFFTIIRITLYHRAWRAAYSCARSRLNMVLKFLAYASNNS